MAQSFSWAKIRGRLVTGAFVLLLALLIVSIRLVEDIGPERRPSDRFKILRVLDGDTVELLGGDKLRLLAIDTPEKGEPLYKEAIRFLDSLVVGRAAEIKFVNRRRDRYGRMLGYLYVDSLFVNRLILENGLGYLYLFEDNDQNSPEVRQLLEAQRQAIANGAGLYAIERTPEAFYLASQRSFRFHRPGCRSVRNFKPGQYRDFTSREEALKIGLSPCRNCKP